ncbi:MAG: hypothetical protein JHD16_03765 [Solirubrobacteraceae bacterium]|nr:hypothetical protein [Solirubrobacteraceae bacterium]
MQSTQGIGDRVTSARHGSTRRLRMLAAATLLTASASLAACSDPGPLDDFGDAQRSQLESAWVAGINATDTAPIPVDQRNARVTALYKACEPLDQATPLLAAVAATCAPTAVAAKLSAVLPERCAKPSTACVRALDRIAQTTEELATASAALSTASASAVPAGACRTELSWTQPQLKAYGDLAQAYRVLALGVERRDEEISALGQRRIDDARAMITPPGTVAERTARFREACGLAD